MVRCDDTGNVYAHEAERYYDRPDEDYQWSCGECDWWEKDHQCPCGCGYACCTWKGELKHYEDEACGQFTERKEQA